MGRDVLDGRMEVSGDRTTGAAGAPTPDVPSLIRVDR
jgi:hypothetical protein